MSSTAAVSTLAPYAPSSYFCFNFTCVLICVEAWSTGQSEDRLENELEMLQNSDWKSFNLRDRARLQGGCTKMKERLENVSRNSGFWIGIQNTSKSEKTVTPPLKAWLARNATTTCNNSFIVKVLNIFSLITQFHLQNLRKNVEKNFASSPPSHQKISRSKVISQNFDLI